MVDSQLPLRVKEAIRDYVKRRDRNRPVSVARLVQAARAFMPDAVFEERELADLITRELVLSGANVDFDGRRNGLDFDSPVIQLRGESVLPLITREVTPLSHRRRVRMHSRKGKGHLF